MADILVNIASASVFPSSTYANAGTSTDGRLMSEKNISRLNKLTVDNNFIWMKLDGDGDIDINYNFYTDVYSYNVVKPGICIIDGRTIEIISSTTITSGISQLPTNVVASYYLALRMDIQLSLEGNADNPSSFYNSVSFEFTSSILPDTSTVKRLYLYKYRITAGPTIIDVEDIRNFCPFDIRSINDPTNLKNLYDYLQFIKTDVRGLNSTDDYFNVSGNKHITIESENGVFDRLHYLFNVGASKPFINDMIKSGNNEYFESGNLVTLNSDKLLNRNILPPAHENSKGAVFIDSGRTSNASSTTFSMAVPSQTLFISNGEIYTTAEVNQNTFSYIQTQTAGVNGPLLRSLTKMDTLVFNAHSNLVLTTEQTSSVRKLNLSVSSSPTFTSMTLGPAIIQQREGSPSSGISINTPVTADSLKSIGNTEVDGNLSVTGISTLTDVSCANIDASGDITANSVWCAVYNDIAENFDMNYGEYEPGDVISRDTKTGSYCLATWDNRKLSVGVISEGCGFLLGGDDKTKHYEPIALCGRVKVKVIGPVMPGDLLTVSCIPGTAQKAGVYEPGTIFGKALEQKDSMGVEKISMLVMTM